MRASILDEARRLVEPGKRRKSGRNSADRRYAQVPLPLQAPLQQSLLALHVCPEPLQQSLLVPQERPLQQSVALLHALPSAEQPHLPVPPLHTLLQQSAADWHAFESAMQPHFFAELQYGFGPQQSLFLPQLWPWAAHPHFNVAELQTAVQHWLPVVHGCASGRHLGWHSLSTPHDPLQQSLFCAHACPSFPQPHVSVALLQKPLQQLSNDPRQEPPSAMHLPQCRPVPWSRSSMQMRPEQQSGP